MDNLDIYNKLKSVPKDVTKKINGGRLKGMTDIKPQWKIQKLTEQFGPCGIGWKYTIDRTWFEPYQDEVLCFVNISLYFKHEEKWSEAIPGHGGNKLVAKESGGLHVSDEGYKMALTDALGNACKYIGVAADIFMGFEPTKYNQDQSTSVPELIKNIAEAKAMKHLANIWEKYLPFINSLPKADIEKITKAKDSRKQQLTERPDNGITQ